MLHFDAAPMNIDDLAMDALIAASEEGDLEMVEQLLAIPAVREHADLAVALSEAAFYGHLNIVNHFLAVPGISEDNEMIYLALYSAINGIRFDIFNRLLQTPATSHIEPAKASTLLALVTTRAYSPDRDQIADRLFAMPAVQEIDNQHFRNALTLTIMHNNYPVANRLLEIPVFRQKLEAEDRAGFLRFFQYVLNDIIGKTSIAGDASITLEQIKLVNKLRDIGERYQISEADFSTTQISVIHRARGDMLSRLLFALDDSPVAPQRSFCPHYAQAARSVPVNVSDDDIMIASPTRCLC